MPSGTVFAPGQFARTPSPPIPVAKTNPTVFPTQVISSPPQIQMVPIPPQIRKKVRAHQSQIDNLAGKLGDYIKLCDDYVEAYDKKHEEIKQLFDMLKRINTMIQQLNIDIYKDIKGDIGKYKDLLRIIKDLENTHKVRSILKEQIKTQNEYLEGARQTTNELLREAQKFMKDPSTYRPTKHMTLPGPVLPSSQGERGHIQMTTFPTPESNPVFSSNGTPVVELYGNLGPSGQSGQYLDIGPTTENPGYLHVEAVPPINPGGQETKHTVFGTPPLESNPIEEMNPSYNAAPYQGSTPTLSLKLLKNQDIHRLSPFMVSMIHCLEK